MTRWTLPRDAWLGLTVLLASCAPLEEEAPVGVWVPITENSELSYRWRDVAVGMMDLCGIAEDGSLICWELIYGRSLAESRVAFRKLDSDRRFVDVSLGPNHGCTLDEEGAVACWGSSDFGINDIDSPFEEAPRPFARDRRYRQFTTRHSEHMCGVEQGGEISCLGYNLQSSLGTGDSSSRFEARTIDASGPWRAVETSAPSCAIQESGALWCWGANSGQILGPIEELREAASPLRIAGVEDLVGLSIMDSEACVIDAQARLWCWGENETGQVGTGDREPQPTPHNVKPELAWSRVSVGAIHTCALSATGQPFCWGPYQGGRESGVDLFPLEPVPVDPRAGWKQVDTGPVVTCMLDAADSICCWGGVSWSVIGYDDPLCLQDFAL